MLRDQRHEHACANDAGYLIRPDEAPGKALKRILRTEAGAARRLLATSVGGGDRNRRIHRARRHFKKIRAALRLARPQARYVYAVENRSFRDLGRRLSGVRDAEAMIEALDRLGAELEPSGYAMLRRALEHRQRLLGEEQTMLDERIAGLLQRLDAARRRLVSAPLEHLDHAALESGRRCVLRRCKRAFAAARDSRDDADLHEWRKQSKYAYYQGQLLSDRLPAERTRIAELDRLNTLIGESHDLVILDELLSDQPDTLGIDTHVAGLRRLLSRRRSELADQAIAFGATLLPQLR